MQADVQLLSPSPTQIHRLAANAAEHSQSPQGSGVATTASPKLAKNQQAVKETSCQVHRACEEACPTKKTAAELTGLSVLAPSDVFKKPSM
jgi:NAD-dependent dihydropyrimidine dehydrogenase PreA subunit